MQNTMRAHSAGQISMEGGVDVNKGHMVYTYRLNIILSYTVRVDVQWHHCNDSNHMQVTPTGSSKGHFIIINLIYHDAT